MTYLNKSRIINIIITILILVLIFMIGLLILNLNHENTVEAGEKKLAEEQSQSRIEMIDISEKETVFIPILNFHHIKAAPAGVDSITASYYIEPQEFEEILQSIIENDYEPVFVSEIVSYLLQKKLPKNKIIALTFDDGNANYYTQAWPILEKYQVKSNQYIMSGVKSENYMTHDQIKELAGTGLVEIGSHTVYHPYLTKEEGQLVIEELTKSQQVLKDLTGQSVGVLSYPFGLYDDRIKKLTAQNGYNAGLTYDQDGWQDPEDLYQLNRISVFPGMNVVKYLEKLENNSGPDSNQTH